MITMQVVSVISPLVVSTEGYDKTCPRKKQLSDLSTKTTSTQQDRRTKRKTVRFSTVTINEHPIIIGCNPAVSSGVPITIDWYSISQSEHSINEYESIRKYERVRHRVMLKQYPSERYAVLQNLGYSHKELRESEKLMDRIRELREQSFLDIVDNVGNNNDDTVDKFQKRLHKLYQVQQSKQRHKQHQSTAAGRIMTQPIVSVIRRISFGGGSIANRNSSARLLKTH